MDREQEEMQFLGFFGIFKESYKLIFSWRKTFSNITLALILPMSFVYLVYTQIYSLFLSKFTSASYDKPSDLISYDWLYFWLFNAAYFTLFSIFSLFSTAAVVYSVACIYTDREVAFKKVMSVVPKVWRRLIVTFFSIFVAIFFYLVATVVVVLIWAVSLAPVHIAGFAVLAILVILFIVGFLYLTTIWHLASTISVLEEAYGFRAMVKSKNLIKGKVWLAMSIFLVLNLAMGFNQIGFKRLVVEGSSGTGMGRRVVFGIIFFLLLSTMILFGLVIQTVIYFVCKSHHHENIDKSALSDQLDFYLLGEYAPSKDKDCQLQVNQYK
ncbi:hypothetical protein like AT4G19950 [Hibiscus trionum]|uniref:Uncharacterized protein n=1 Tax=Hibiscus trionum TaxID=183268 RepID=A0A9W7HTP7_HIBTR|nr:hypothetical protein like AT4G19950 [Hibiscus trionum]